MHVGAYRNQFAVRKAMAGINDFVRLLYSFVRGAANKSDRRAVPTLRLVCPSCLPLVHSLGLFVTLVSPACLSSYVSNVVRTSLASLRPHLLAHLFLSHFLPDYLKLVSKLSSTCLPRFADLSPKCLPVSLSRASLPLSLFSPGPLVTDLFPNLVPIGLGFVSD